MSYQLRSQLTAKILNFRQQHQNYSNPNLMYKNRRAFDIWQMEFLLTKIDKHLAYDVLKNVLKLHKNFNAEPQRMRVRVTKWHNFPFGATAP
jgi:hypothetical protein